MDKTVAMDVAVTNFADKLRRFNASSTGNARVVHNREHVVSIYHQEERKAIIYDKAATLLVKRSK